MLLGDGYAYEIAIACSNPNDIMFYAFKPYKATCSNNLLTIWDKRNIAITIGSKYQFDGQGLHSRLKLVFPHHLFRMF